MTILMAPFAECVCGFKRIQVDVSFEPIRFYKWGSQDAIEHCPECGKTLDDTAVSESLELWLQAHPDPDHPARRRPAFGSRVELYDWLWGGTHGTVWNYSYSHDAPDNTPVGIGNVYVTVDTAMGPRYAALFVGEFGVLTTPSGTEFEMPPEDAIARCRDCGEDFPLLEGEGEERGYTDPCPHCGEWTWY